MSLINDMLNDLEQRRSEQSAKPINLGWLSGQSTPQKGISTKPARVISVIAAVILVAIVAWLYRPLASLERAQQLLRQTPASNPVPPSPASSPIIQGASWSTDGNVTRLQWHLSEATPYSVKREPDGLTLRFYGVENHLNIKDLKPVAPAQSLSIQQDSEDVVVSLIIAGDFTFSDRVQKAPNAAVELLIQSISDSIAQTHAKQVGGLVSNADQSKFATSPATKKDANAETSIVAVKPDKILSANTIAAKTTLLSSEKITNQLTVSQQDMQLTRLAKQRLRGGETYQAEQMLKNFVLQQPQATRSGKLLVSVWLSQQQFEAAGNLLDMMLSGSGGDLDLHLLKARLLLAQGETAAAVDWLMTVKPEVQGHQDFYELLGLAARQNQQYTLSEQVYRGLLNTDARHGDWWVGLGIALDAQARISEARNAYQQALATARISAPLQQYAQQRLAAN